MRSRIGLGLIAGGLGGFLGWILQENLIHYSDLVVKVNGVCQEVPSSSAATVSILCVCGFIGVFLGAVDGIIERKARKIVIGMGIGAMAGIVIGALGNNLGGLVYSALGGRHALSNDPSPFSFTMQIIARVFQVGLWGLGIGTGVAISTLNPRRIGYGALGGLIGGSVTGFVFDLVAAGTTPIHSALGASGCTDVGGLGRAICFTGIGALTGLFIGIVEELLKQAWVTVLAGRNEGRNIVLYSGVSILGRDERCEVPLFGDSSVGAQHAAIRADGRRHLLTAAATKGGTLVNGQPVATGTDLLLRDGDMIQIGTHRILFHEKATATHLSRPNPDGHVKKTGPANVPMPSHLCAFCGAPKDVHGNCRCSIGDGPALAPIGAPMGTAVLGDGGFGSPAYAPPLPVMGGMAAPIAPQRALGQIVGLEGPYAGQVFAISAVNMEVGREMGKEVALPGDSTVSRSHARLSQETGTLIVMDLGSSNGTYVNGQRLFAPTPLNPGDIVQFGSSKFRYE